VGEKWQIAMKTWIAPLYSLQRRASRRILLISRGGKLVYLLSKRTFQAVKMSEAMAEAPVELTENAARRIVEIMRREPAGSFLRIGVDGGGCSGFTYTYNISTERAPGDLVVERDGATVAIDPVSLDLLRGSRIDFIDDVMGRMFKIVNPGVTASCGCGSSFAI
jgi:iron-sulfur cluster assembly accessory protein